MSCVYNVVPRPLECETDPSKIETTRLSEPVIIFLSTLALARGFLSALMIQHSLQLYKILLSTIVVAGLDTRIGIPIRDNRDKPYRGLPY